MRKKGMASMMPTSPNGYGSESAPEHLVLPSSAKEYRPLPIVRSRRVRELIFLGTGTSSCIPNVYCLTATPVTCGVCMSAMMSSDSPNKRRNTSALFRVDGFQDGRVRNILVDCGKTFYESAVEWFAKYRLRRMDAVILSHGHADAVFGLDDLRQWTLRGIIQDHVDVYLSKETMAVISQAFPYLVDTKQATGGGDVPALKFHVLDDINQAFEIEGIKVMPLPVEHGKAGSEPYISLGFRIDNISYISDASKIPESTRKLMSGSDVIVLDGLKENEAHSSHFSVEQAVDEILALRPVVGLLTGFCHSVDHAQLNKRLAAWPRGTVNQDHVDGLISSTNTSLAAAYDGMRMEFDP